MAIETSDERALARRAFLRGAAFLATAAPIMTEASLAHAAQTAAPPSGMALHGQGPNAPASGMVLINANENPLGPSKAACDAIVRVAPPTQIPLSSMRTRISASLPISRPWLTR